MSSSNCCFLTCIQISQEAGQVVWYSHLSQNLPQFIVIHTVKGFGIVNLLKPHNPPTQNSTETTVKGFWKYNNSYTSRAGQMGEEIIITKFCKPLNKWAGFDPWLGRFPGEGNGNLLQYSCLENPMEGGAWWATVHRVTKSWTRLSNFTSLSSKWADMQSLDALPIVKKAKKQPSLHHKFLKYFGN